MFVAVEPADGGDFKPLMLIGDEVVASQHGLNIFIGQRHIAVPRRDLALEFDRPIYSLRLLDNLLAKSPVGFLRLKLPFLPVAIRLDDVPTTWNLVMHRRRTLGHEDMEAILAILRAFKACLLYTSPSPRDRG